MAVDMSTVATVLSPAPALPVRLKYLDRLPGMDADDPFERLAAAWLVGITAPHTQRAYRGDLTAWARWCTDHAVHPLAAQRFHVDAYKAWLSTQPSPRTGRVRAPATVARSLSALSEFYSHGVALEVLTHSPVAEVRRPRVSANSQAVGLTADELRRLLDVAQAHSPRAAALVSILMLTGVRISEALGADVRDYGSDSGHRTLRVVRRGDKRARVVLPAVAARAIDTHLAGRSTGPLFVTEGAETRWAYWPAVKMLTLLCQRAGISEEVTAHSFRHSYATEALAMGVPLQDVQDAMGHADPRTTRRYDRGRGHLDRSPNDRLAATLLGGYASDGQET